MYYSHKASVFVYMFKNHFVTWFLIVSDHSRGVKFHSPAHIVELISGSDEENMCQAPPWSSAFSDM